ncbi:hypothetical protein GQ55_1G341700 [Panicum hallii var. hallii]|uniref:Uncharacterized protein n=1 Tax=Panicum hallii var. hallii TaxID=1504633 RepID=A0A2T7FAI5_9POAL|nr:hypothetical protein GQ55_1G341700 [Panicum hallii var. hallii]
MKDRSQRRPAKRPADSVQVSSYLRQRQLPGGRQPEPARLHVCMQRLAWEITRSRWQICCLWTLDNDWWMFVLGSKNNLLAQNFARKRARKH